MIRERNPQGALIAASDRANYFPITFIAPLAQNRDAVGYDVASNPLQHSAMQIARDQGTATLTAPLELVQDDARTSSMLLFYLVYISAQLPTTLAERRSSLRGYVVAALHFAEVIRSAIADDPADSFQLRAADISGDDPQQLFSNAPWNSMVF